MKERQEARPKPEFSPGLATVGSLPLFVLVSVLYGIEQWQIAADALGWTGPNLPYLLKKWFVGRDTTGWFVAVACISPGVVIFCFKTQGHNLLRRIFLVVHLAASVLLVGGTLLLLIMVMLSGKASLGM